MEVQLFPQSDRCRAGLGTYATGRPRGPHCREQEAWEHQYPLPSLPRSFLYGRFKAGGCGLEDQPCTSLETWSQPLAELDNRLQRGLGNRLPRRQTATPSHHQRFTSPVFHTHQSGMLPSFIIISFLLKVRDRLRQRGRPPYQPSAPKEAALPCQGLVHHCL